MLATRRATAPLLPWTFRGVIMDKGLAESAFTNHPSVIDFGGES